MVQVNWLRRDGRRAAFVHGLIGTATGKAPNWSLAVPSSWLGGIGQRENLMVKPQTY